MEARIIKLENALKKVNKRIKTIERFMMADVKQQYMEVDDTGPRPMTFKQFCDGTYPKDADGN